ncbi:Ribose operon repressor [Anaerococcus vaginalis]|uniref:Ribose operon repressor n=1 Tax=Anaerococcus vaginalis TaxID=33037 RepID=A0A6N2UCI2_9FIRM
MKNAPTINDVARIAGVSKSTVSRYLNGKPLKEITSIKIKKAIEETNYQANMFARLSAKKSFIIGIVVPGFDSTVNPRILTYVDRYLRNKNYTPLIINTEDDMDFEVKSIENLSSMKVDGIIVVASYITDKHKEVVKNISTPVIFLGREFKEGISIVDDNYRAGYEFGKYVGKAGIKSVTCLWVDEKDIQVGKIRKKGVVDGLKEEGVKNISEKITDFSYYTSYKKAMEILKDDKRPQAIMCATDRIAHGVYKACI